VIGIDFYPIRVHPALRNGTLSEGNSLLLLIENFAQVAEARVLLLQPKLKLAEHATLRAHYADPVVLEILLLSEQHLLEIDDAGV
jgi:hypothetical protein